MSDNSVNFYKTLDDFLDDMDERRKDKNKFVAIEFIYKGETYRINNEYLTPTFAYRVPGVKFWVFLVHFKWVDGWCDPDFFQLWNVCNDRLLSVLASMEGSNENGRKKFIMPVKYKPLYQHAWNC